MKEYDIFISYNKADVEFAEQLVTAIENQEYNGRKLRCFYDSWDIEVGENILLKIENALSNSRFVGLIMSPDWLKSDWTKLERFVPVYEDPAGIKGRIIPILRRNCTIPPTIRILKWLDFRTDSNFDKELKKIVGRLIGKSIRSSIASDQRSEINQFPSFDLTIPDIQNEKIASNLFQVMQLPMYINRACARVKRRNEVWDMLGEGVALPIFAIREESQEIFSFAELANPQQKITKLVSSPSVDKLSTQKVLSSKEYSIIIELLNRAMTEHMRSIGMVYDWKNKKTFFPLEKDGDNVRYSKWTVGKREYPRLVVQKTKSGKHYVHRSCKATFTKLGNYLFLKILPGWHFTYDGLSKGVDGKIMSSLSTRWMNIQRNHSVLDDVRFWVYKLSKGTEKIELNVGADSDVIIASTPMSADIDQGIEEDYRERLWLEEEPATEESIEFLEELESLETLDNEEEDEGPYD